MGLSIIIKQATKCALKHLFFPFQSNSASRDKVSIATHPVCYQEVEQPALQTGGSS